MKGKVLFINAKDLVSRKDGFSFLDDSHINQIITAYSEFTNIDKFCTVKSIDEILENQSKLSIPLYVTTDVKFNENDDLLTNDVYNEWLVSSCNIRDDLEKIIVMTGGTDDE